VQAGRAERVGQVRSHHGEVMHGDAAPLMDLPHRRAGVRPGAPEYRAEEFDLTGLHAPHVRAGVETGQEVIVEYSAVEILDHDFERVVTADLLVQRGHAGSAKSGEQSHAT
jgi:hypothetical protein